MIFVGGGVTVEGNGAQPVDVQTAVFRPVGGFGFFFEVVFVKGGLTLFVVDVRQRDFPPLLVKQNLDARNRIEAV